MAAIKGADTRPELYVRKSLHAAGYRFRLHRKDLPGKPDLVLPRFRLVIFVHGCFWHGHRCGTDHRPRSNAAYWTEKIARNVERDARNQSLLREAGWIVRTVWECQLVEGTEALIRELRSMCDGQEHSDV